MTSDITLVLGGARSGKSLFAENLVLKNKLRPLYLATARGSDDEMVQRIEDHQARRGEEWHTIEEPLALVDALELASYEKRIVLVDCLTLWINNLMMAEADVTREADLLVKYLANAPFPIVFVSNEVGQGIIPDNKMAREFVDLSGLVHQRVAEACNHVYFVTAGIPQKLK